MYLLGMLEEGEGEGTGERRKCTIIEGMPRWKVLHTCNAKTSYIHTCKIFRRGVQCSAPRETGTSLRWGLADGRVCMYCTGLDHRRVVKGAEGSCNESPPWVRLRKRVCIIISYIAMIYIKVARD